MYLLIYLRSLKIILRIYILYRSFSKLKKILLINLISHLLKYNEKIENYKSAIEQLSCICALLDGSIRFHCLSILSAIWTHSSQKSARCSSSVFPFATCPISSSRMSHPIEILKINIKEVLRDFVIKRPSEKKLHFRYKCLWKNGRTEGEEMNFEGGEALSVDNSH